MESFLLPSARLRHLFSPELFIVINSLQSHLLNYAADSNIIIDDLVKNHLLFECIFYNKSFQIILDHKIL